MTAKNEILVTGGAGYIGSHMVLGLLDAGRRVVVVDDLSTGSHAALHPDAKFIEGRIQDPEILNKVFDSNDVGAILHFAGSVRVDESVEDPLKYYGNNTFASHALISAAVAAGVPHFVFSSTAAVYGTPDKVPVSESAPTQPINPYGWSKLMTERVLLDVCAVSQMNCGILRYFNVAGADPELRAGQRTRNATHLIKVAVEAALGLRDEVVVFGDDYDTADGTGVRDYIHVTDLVAAHLELLEFLEASGKDQILNCGYGRGYSVYEVLAGVEKLTGRPVSRRIAGRRAGDAAQVIADNRKIRDLLGWSPRHDDLLEILGSALEWESKIAGQGAR